MFRFIFLTTSSCHPAVRNADIEEGKTCFVISFAGVTCFHFQDLCFATVLEQKLKGLSEIVEFSRGFLCFLLEIVEI